MYKLTGRSRFPNRVVTRCTLHRSSSLGNFVRFIDSKTIKPATGEMAAKQFVQEYEDQRREELIKATYYEVAEKGYSAVTLQDIAKRAGVSKGSTLYYFATKEDLFLGALEWMINQFDIRIGQAIENVEDQIGRAHV